MDRPDLPVLDANEAWNELKEVDEEVDETRELDDFRKVAMP